jgi:hypothetical protein
MKKLAAILCLSALTTGAFAQGLVTFNNGVTSLITSGAAGSMANLAAGSAGSYYFALLTSPSSAGPFTFAGVYATNTAGAGKIAGGTVPVTGWAPGATMSYEVAGWSASLGTTWTPGWLIGNFATAGFFGISAVATGTAGGGSPVPAPAWNIFGGSGLTGFNLSPVAPVPEPTSMALAGLGAAALLIFRRRK